MARTTCPTMPVDTAPKLQPGIVYREADIFCQDAANGFYEGFSGDTPLGASKGNRSSASLPARRPLTGPGPFANLRGGR